MNLVFGGDFCPQNIINIDRNIIEMTNNSDGMVINLEGYISKNCDTKNTLCIPEEVIKELIEKLNIKYVSLANNHSMDNGEEGFKYTIKVLNDCEVKVFGTKETPFIELNDTLIYSAVWEKTGVNNKHLNVLKKNEFLNLTFPEDKFVIFFPHWGIDLENLPLPWQYEFALSFHKKYNGIIIGHHSHVLHPVLKYRNKYSFFSIGNFYMPFNNITYYYPDFTRDSILVLFEDNKIDYVNTQYNENLIKLSEKKDLTYLDNIDKKDYITFFNNNRRKKHYPNYENPITDFFKENMLKLIGRFINSKIGTMLWKWVKKK
ncbi:Bacterial capsule synthesis protein PGA_cap [Marinitoga piezophila KA3]|uniref:Bacterial capsule synthesis protein PGA_cap n=1 Tax=Marinitoga piezophila (strain DSM 14283 / JCM 11233 / KA3) TaxID=443254 RepID=H2J2X3_MARPK|nr:CapA family protein [Marinitoga piezophila]AEX85664.1 Bacterial capsule synthesis protein PGA_cap [Marinitoga piezophila KA3]